MNILIKNLLLQTFKINLQRILILLQLIEIY